MTSQSIELAKLIIECFTVLVTLLGAHKFVIRIDFTVNSILTEIKEIKLAVNDHDLRILRLEKEEAYERGLKEGKTRHRIE